MLAHIFKLVWNRRRSNILMQVEILISFLVLAGVVTVFTHHAIQMTRPIGFDYDNVWEVAPGSSLFPGTAGYDGSVVRATLEQMLVSMGEMDEVQRGVFFI